MTRARDSQLDGESRRSRSRLALSYAVAFVVPALDAVVPVLPSETAIVALGVATAGSVDPRIAVLLLLAAAGACAGDNLSYLVGHRFEPWADRRLLAGGSGRKRRAWARTTLEHYRARLIVACRFLLGGRTAVTLTCGATSYPRDRLVLALSIAIVVSVVVELARRALSWWHRRSGCRERRA